MLACVSEDDWSSVVRSALDRAKAGDAAARQWLSDRVMTRVKDEAAVRHTGKIEVEVTYQRRAVREQE